MKGGSHEYYFQNTSYYVAPDTEKGFWGNTNTVKILFIDSNANGYFFDDDDHLLFNTWDPYAQDSAYQEISDFNDNLWYRVSELKNKYFMTFRPEEDLSGIAITNINSAYIGNKATGKLRISNLPPEASVRINGQEYRQDGKGILDAKIEYGHYQVDITREYHLDFTDTFTIDTGSTQYTLAYKETDTAGLFVLANHTFRNWKLTFEDAGGTKTVYNTEKVSLKPGRYKITVSSGGFSLVKEADISAGSTVTYDYSSNTLSSGE
jgi:hypothetical protein